MSVRSWGGAVVVGTVLTTVGTVTPAFADASAVTFTSPTANQTVSGTVGIDFVINPAAGATATSFDASVGIHTVYVTLPNGGCTSSCVQHADVPTSNWAPEPTDPGQPSPNVQDGPQDVVVYVHQKNANDFGTRGPSVVVDNARPVLTLDPTGLNPYGKYFLDTTSPTADASITVGYAVTAATGHDSDPDAAPASVTVRLEDPQRVLETSTVDSPGHRAFVWDTHAVRSSTVTLLFEATSRAGAPSQQRSRNVSVDHGLLVSVPDAPTATVPYGWTGPITLRIPTGLTDPFLTNCPTTNDLNDVTYAASLMVSVDGSAPTVVQTVTAYDSWYLYARQPPCWQLKHLLPALTTGLTAGTHTIVASQTDNRGITSAAPAFTVDVAPAPAFLTLTGPALVASGAAGTLTGKLSSAAPTGGVPVTFSFQPHDSSTLTPLATVTTDASGTARFVTRPTGNGTWHASSAATRDLTAGQATPSPVAVDNAAPRITSAYAGPAVASTATTQPVTFGYSGTDDVAVASYDVGVRSAGPGAPLGSVTYPTAWQHTTSRSVHLTVTPGGQVCFTVRARDRVNKLSAWTVLRCSAVPYDDRALTRSSSGTTQLTQQGALNATVTRLSPGGQLRLAAQTSRYLAVCLYAGPGQGTVGVYRGSALIERISLAATRAGRRTVMVPGGTGIVSIRGVSGRSLVDGLAVRRI